MVVDQFLKNTPVGEALDDLLFHDFFLVIGRPFHGGQHEQVKKGIQTGDGMSAQGIVGHQRQHGVNLQRGVGERGGCQQHGIATELPLYVAQDEESLLACLRGSRLYVVSLVAVLVASHLTEYVFAAVRFVNNGIVKAQGIHIRNGIAESHADHFPVFLVLDFLVALRFLAALSEDIDQFSEQLVRYAVAEAQSLESFIGQNRDGLFRNGLVEVHL